jgi:hypothetical protein
MAPAPSRCAYQWRVLTNDVCGSGFVHNTSVKLFQGSRAQVEGHFFLLWQKKATTSSVSQQQISNPNEHSSRCFLLASPVRPQAVSTHNGTSHSHKYQLGRRPRCLPPRGVGSHRRVQWARRGLAAVGGVQGGERGGEGVPGDPAAAGAVRGTNITQLDSDEVDVGARSGDAAMGGHARAGVRTLRSRVLRGERHPRRPRGNGPRRWEQPRYRPHLASGDAFQGSRGVRGASATVMRRHLLCSCNRGGRER